MTTPTPAPAPMTASRLMELLDIAGRNPSDTALKKEIERQLREGADALTARVAELERERQYTCEQHRDEVRKGERCVWCELAAARGAFDLSESERQRLAGRINATEAELAAARKVEDGEVAAYVQKLRDFDVGDTETWIANNWPLEAADLLTRLSAALKEAEARETDAKTLQHQLASDLTVAVARALQTKDTTP